VQAKIDAQVEHIANVERTCGDQRKRLQDAAEHIAGLARELEEARRQAVIDLHDAKAMDAARDAANERLAELTALYKGKSSLVWMERVKAAESALASRPVAVPVEWLAFKDAFDKYVRFGPIWDEVLELRKAYRALPTAGVRCVRGWAHASDMSTAGWGCQTVYESQAHTTMVPVTLCWSDAPGKDGGT
jgi:hypothetical protein